MNPGEDNQQNRGQDQLNQQNQKGKRRKSSMKPFVEQVVRPRDNSQSLSESSGSHPQTEPSTRAHPTVESRETIEPRGNIFIPGHEAARAVTHSIKSFDIHPSAGCWTLVPDALKQMYWNEFQCVWHPKFDQEMYDLFLTKAQNRYKQIMNHYHNDYRSGRSHDLGALPGDRNVWDTLVEYWNSDAFKARSQRASQNRRSDPNETGITKHRGGSRSIFEQRLKFKVDHGREPTYVEGLKMIHPVDEATGRLTYFCTTDIHNKLKDVIAASQPQSQMSEDGSCTENTSQPPVDKNKLYLDVVGVNKGLVVGLGAQGRSVRKEYRSSSSSMNSHPSEVESLRKQCEEMAAERARDQAKFAAMQRWMDDMPRRLNVPPPIIEEGSGTINVPDAVVGVEEEEDEEDEDSDNFHSDQ